MVLNSLLRKRSFLLLGIVLLAGCGNNSAPAPMAAAPQAAAPTPTPAPKSATPNSFDEVTSQLEPGGDFYLYLNTQQFLSKLDGFINSLHDMAASQSGGDPDVDKGFGVIKDIVHKSGVEDVTGFGASSFCYTPGSHRNKIFVHHDPDKGSGLLWTLFGKAPHPLTQLDFLPSDTAYVAFTDFDLAQLINFARQEALQSGVPEAQQAVNQWQTQFEGLTQLKLDDVLNSLNGSIGSLVTLDATSTINVPSGNQTITIPTPRLAIFIGVKDDTIFKQIDKMAGANPGVIKVDQPDLRMRTMALPMVPGLNLRPTVAQWNGYLIVATDDQLINDLVAVQKGGAGFKTAADYLSLSANLPAEGNAFGYTSPTFVETVHKFQSQMSTNQANLSASQAQAIQSWISKYQPMFSGYSVGSQLPNGYLTISQGKFAK